MTNDGKSITASIGESDLESMMKLARRVARHAARFVADNRPAGRVAVTATKSSATDVVTELDQRCEDLIRHDILTARPHDGFLGEEGEAIPSSSSVTWVVDPIDGTVNFVYGLPDSAVSIAAMVDGEVTIGVVINITTGIEYWARKGGGAFIDDNGSERQLQAPQPPEISHALVATGFHYTRELRAHQGKAVARLLPEVRDIRRTGSAAINLCQLATGQIDAYVEQGLKPWDLAAGGLIAAESGIILAGLDVEPDERLVMASHADLAPAFFALVRHAGF